MSNRLFLLDGMALLYRAHFAFIRSPIFTSDKVNTSALYGFTNTLLDIITNQKPTHIAVALDTHAPTPRHEMFPAYKAQRDEMPEDIGIAIPQIKRLLEAMRIPVLTKDGYEADDIIGTLAQHADERGWETFMVTPDKDFGQLVTEHVRIYKPGRSGSDTEILGPAEVCARWGIERPEQVIDILGLMGDASDNIPGIKGVGEKTATELIKTHGSVEAIIASADKLKGKLQEKVKTGAEMAVLSKKLATIITDAPVDASLDDLRLHPFDDEKLKAFFTEFEFNAMGKRLFGDDFIAGRGRLKVGQAAGLPETTAEPADLFASADQPQHPAKPRTIADTPHEYRLIRTTTERKKFIAELLQEPSFCFDLETSSLDPRDTEIVGLAFSWKKGEGAFVLFPRAKSDAEAVLQEFREAFTRPDIEKIGHNLKFDLSVLLAHGVEVAGPFFDTMLAHSLIEPDQRHGMDYCSETYLGYTPVPITSLIGEQKDLFGEASMAEVAAKEPEKVKDYAAEDADVTWQLGQVFRPMLDPSGQARVFREIEAPLLPVLVRMETNGVKIDVQALREFGVELDRKGHDLQRKIHDDAGVAFNLNSPKQLGEVLFERLRLMDKPKRTATGQYQTNEQVLQSLIGTHPIVQDVLDYREVTKLKSTYVDALPAAVSRATGRVHTSFMQVLAGTGRMASTNPNLQNIPIRTEQGREIRKAFVPGEDGWLIMSADYSQIELRVMAALSGDKAMLEAFEHGHDIHAATAARVYGVPLDGVLPEMRRTAKMVNFGIIYGISAFGLSQRLGIPRAESAQIIENYFKQFPGVKRYIDHIVADAKKLGYVETLTGRRRYLRDINSANATIRAAAERVAMNAPIQGTAADMIKLAMIKIDHALRQADLRARMLLQVHDELVFELPPEEVEEAKLLIEEGMKNALHLPVPVEVETGTGNNWLEAH
ncbi:MAG: DNA polymerase I [Verrucomicrobiaceae bacterium]|nr:DNA polymerase I [Verrucomicrobiaceae bacterium]